MDKIPSADLIHAHGSARMSIVTMRKKKEKPVRTKFNVVIERDKDGVYYGVVPELPGCHTQARSLDELQKRLKEAILLYLEVVKDIPEDHHFIGIQQIEVTL
jgi:predicted RNase H-like HicB family nuclease